MLTTYTKNQAKIHIYYFSIVLLVICVVRGRRSRAFCEAKCGRAAARGRLLVRNAALIEVRGSRKIPKAAKNLQGFAAFGRSEYTEQSETPQFGDIALPPFGRDIFLFPCLAYPPCLCRLLLQGPPKSAGRGARRRTRRVLRRQRRSRCSFIAAKPQ